MRTNYLLWLASVLSGILLFSCFPPWSWGEAAWVALVPLVLVARATTPRRAFALGYTAGLAWWLLSAHWLHHVSYAGWVCLALYCALYVGLFAALVAFWTDGRRDARWPGHLLFMVAGTAGWVGLEYFRSTLFTGFAWNPLAASQVGNLPILQAASWGGSYLVSAVVVFLNLAIAVTLEGYILRKGRPLKRAHVELMLGLTLVAVFFALGMRTLNQDRREADEVLTVGVIQPGIPQDEKWNIMIVRSIYDRLMTLTGLAVSSEPLDLVVWPETALPDDMLLSRASYALVRDLLTNNVPILVGSMDTQLGDHGEAVHFNSAFFMDPRDGVVERYDKRHLVIFGEYVPFEEHLPFFKALTPIQASFTGGATSTVFRVKGSTATFSSLICFEDTVARLARASVLNGARLLINQTNDAWFDISSASRQHMAHSVLRCVENRVPGIRAANTGVSCFIDRFGRVYDVLEKEDGSTVFAGFQVSRVELLTRSHVPTPYTLRGDVLGASCSWIALLILLAGAGRSFVQRRR